MKKIIIIVSFVLLPIFIFAQAFVDVGLKVGGGTSWLLNTNIFDDNSYSHRFSGAFNGGIKTSINFRDKNAITLEALFSSQKQNFDYRWTEDSGTKFDDVSEISWNNLDLYLLYRFYANSAFTEIGIMNSLVQKIEMTDPGLAFEAEDVSAYFQDSYLSAVFGGGALVAGEDSWTLMAGMRFHYAFKDFVSDEGNDLNALSNRDIDFTFPNPFRQDFSGQEFNPYAEDSKTNPLFVEIIFELNFGLGAFAKQTCGGRTKWIGGGRY